MKSYSIYRDIREGALIFGLPLGSFALQMSAVIGGLLSIIFSFGFLLILFVLVGNIGLYIFLLRFKHFPRLYTTSGLHLISNKETGISRYEN